MKQPDFDKVFSDHFGSVPRKVTYSVRQDPDRYHDLIFLSNLIHDATFKMSDVVVRGKRLTLSIMRDCWELLNLHDDRMARLHVAASKLTISPVSSVEWRIPHGRREEWPFEIRGIWMSRTLGSETREVVIEGVDGSRFTSCSGVREVVIEGHQWSCVVTLNERSFDVSIPISERMKLWLDDGIRIRLADQETPYLPSTRAT